MVKKRQEIERKIVEKPIASLKPHPRQAKLFHDATEEEIKELAESMANNGLDHPVEILPDGTIVAGHQRVKAAQKLGWKSIRCWVRNDLAKAGEEAVECRLIEDNVIRRQLTKLDEARA